jgi:putative acetyltransferase
MGFTIEQASTEGDFELGKNLMLAYQKDIGVDLAFQDFDNEVRNVSSVYSAPSGAFFIAFQDNTPIGCFGIRSIDGSICELKRMFLTKENRKKGLGEVLLKKAIAVAIDLKFGKMRLDTLPSMNSAFHLYQKLHFTEIEPYRHNPISGSKFLELELPTKID